MNKIWGLTWLVKISCLISTRCETTLATNVVIFNFKTIFKSFLVDLHNNPKPFEIYPPFQIEITNDHNLINKSNNNVLGIICWSLETGTVLGWKLNITHRHFFVTCEIPNSLKDTMSLALPLVWKVVVLLKQISTQWSGNALQITIFYKKTDDDCRVIEKPTRMRKIINWKWERCLM
jgi:hypothetical protein